MLNTNVTMHSPESGGNESRPPTELTPEDLRALISRQYKLLEQERREISRELHDGAVQDLTVLALELSLLESGLATQRFDAQAAEAKVDELQRLVCRLMDGLGQIKSRLRPDAPD